MGAAHWDVTIPDVGTFDFRKMTRDERGKFHGQFMAACRRHLVNRKGKARAS